MPPRFFVPLWCLVFLCPGCEERVKGWSYGVAKPSNTDGPSRDYRQSGEKSRSDWSIVLDRFEGADHKIRAEARREDLQEKTGLKDIWVGPEGGGSVVYYRRYKSQDDPAAKLDMDYWRGLAASGQIRLSVLLLSALNDPTTAAAAGNDLRTAAGRGIYTLQVAYFDENCPGGRFRAAAEHAAEELRKQGAEAFYYHGPNRSMVTLGVFNQDAVTMAGAGQYEFSPPLRTLMQRYPYNSANTIRPTVEQADKPRQPSFLVVIPGSK